MSAQLAGACEPGSSNAWTALRSLVSPTAALLYSDEVDVPLALGVRRCVVIVPRRMVANASTAARSAVVAHELAHVARRDGAWQLVERFVQALLWFHPLVWLAGRKMAFVRERACDEFALHAVGNFDLYAHTLLDVATHLARRRTFGLEASMARSANLGRRLEALSPSQGSDRCQAALRVRLSLGGIALSGTLLLASLAVGIRAASSSEPASTDEMSSASPSKTASAATSPGELEKIQAILERFERASDAVTSYDVYLTDTITFPLKTVVVELDEPRAPELPKRTAGRSSSRERRRR